ncbi:MAG TPA: hypothetical protein VN937_20560 [Blastocatellia bacterium]|nr:hypothetical protein [Blastocatellia bacterium]
MSSYEDKIWLDAKRKLDGICQDASDARADLSNALILTHFKSTLSIVEGLLSARGIDYKSYSPLDFSALCFRGHDTGSPSVWIGLASHFQARSSAPSSARMEQSRPALRVLVAEHHPLASRDEAVLDAARSLACDAQVIHYTSLTDPLLNHFGGERIRGLMTQMGMEEQECISSPVINRAIRNAQEKIQKQVQREMQTTSPEEWFRFNLPPRNRPL